MGGKHGLHVLKLVMAEYKLGLKLLATMKKMVVQLAAVPQLSKKVVIPYLVLLVMYYIFVS